jgi:lipopolysaccharide export system permease protein
MIIKNLILIEWFKAFAASVFALMLLITVSNLVTGFLRDNVTATEVFLNFIIESPSFFARVLPISCLTASLFSINKLKNRNELVAIFAAGFSRRQFFSTIALASFLICLVQLLLTGFIDPWARSQRHQLIPNSDQKFRNLEGQGLRASTIGSGKIWYKSGDYFFAFSSFNKERDELNDVTLYYFSEDNKLHKRVRGLSLRNTGDNNWVFPKAVVQTNLDNQIFPDSSEMEDIQITLDESVDDFKRIESDITTLPLNSLIDYVSRLRRSGINTDEYSVMLYEKFSAAFVCIVFALLASVAAYTPNRRSSNMGKNIAFIFAFTIIYWLIHSYATELGKSSKLYPWLASFGVPLLFCLFIAQNFYAHRKLRT